MNKMIQFGLISLFLILTGVGALIASFNLNTTSLIILITVSVILILSGLYFLLFALAFKFGKCVKGIITNKIYIPVDNDENVGNSYYRYEYEIVSNGKIKKGKFRIYELDKDVNSIINIGTEINAKKLMFITVVDANSIIDDIREKYKDNEEYQKILNQKNKINRKTFKKDFIVGISVFALIVICCLIYVISII